jgi:hypothetical protein
VDVSSASFQHMNAAGHPTTCLCRGETTRSESSLTCRNPSASWQNPPSGSNGLQEVTNLISPIQSRSRVTYLPYSPAHHIIRARPTNLEHDLTPDSFHDRISHIQLKSEIRIKHQSASPRIQDTTACHPATYRQGFSENGETKEDLRSYKRWRSAFE